MYTPSSSFYEAAGYLSNASSLSKVSSNVKLELYGLFKHLTTSPTPSTTRPSIFDMTGRAKWDAWHNTGNKYSNPEHAESRYIEIAKSLGWTEGSSIEEQQAEEEEVNLDALDDEPESKGTGSSGNSASPGSGGLGLAVSKAQLPETVEDRSMHGLAVDNNVGGLDSLLKKSPNMDLNARDEFGYTPLHLASDRGNLDIVKLLLEKGADASLEDSDGFSALELARVAGHQEIQKLLSNASST